jgi:protoporphyrinogen oxidase
MADQIVILGAGACGLWAAHELVKRGHTNVTVIEQCDGPGGLCRTNTRDGFRFDLGGHRFITADEALAREVCGFMGARLLQAERKSRIYRQGRYYNYPVDPGDLLKSGLMDNLRLATSLIRARVMRNFRSPSHPDLESWLKGEYGGEIYRRFFFPYTAKVWGHAPAELSASWATQRIPGLKAAGLFKSLLGLSSGSGGRSFARRYLYPRHGMGELFEVLAEELRKSGVTILYSTKVSGIKMDDGNAAAVVCESGERRTELPCGTVISTIPVTALARFMAIDKEISESLSYLRFRAIRFLNIMLDCDAVSDNTWVYVPEPEFIFGRVQEPKKRSPDNAPPGKTSLMLEIPCNQGDEIWRMPVQQLFEQCKSGLWKMGLGHAMERAAGYFDTSVECGYPVSLVDTPVHRERILERMNTSRNIITCGRQGAFSYLFMDQAMQMGALAARKAVDWHSVSSQQLYGIGETKGYVESRVVMQETRSQTN